MKILFDNFLPFLLAHGGFQIQIEQTIAALRKIGVDVDYLRWWDEYHPCDLIHYFGRPFPSYIDLAHRKGIRVVFTALHSSLGVRSDWSRRAQRMITRVAEAVFPAAQIDRLSWPSYRVADACVVLTAWEAHLVQQMFDAPPQKIHVVPNGVEEIFFAAKPGARGKWLVTTASILPVKRIVETAQAAVQAQTPYWVIGRPMSETEPYYRQFCDLCRANPQWLRYEGAITDRVELAVAYREARGFVMLSEWETMSISALEAAASGCPLLLCDLPWARSVFGEEVSYCRPGQSPAKIAPVLQRFYAAAPNLKSPQAAISWTTVAHQLKTIYETVLRTS